MAVYPIKVLLDKNRKPFIPYVALETVLVDESNTTLAELLNGMYTMDEVNALLENEISKFDVYPDEASLPQSARDGNVAVVEDGENYFMYFYFDGGWYKLTQQGPQGPQGDAGAAGNSGVYTGPEEPTDEDISIWIDTSDETVVEHAEGSSF
jgi:hypothetical protein